MLNYFKFKDVNKTWLEITREERFFCSELYHDIKNNIKGFIKFLNENCSVNLDENTYWEIGYEVCFYRDFMKAKGISIKQYNKERIKVDSSFKQYPPKRTFDICLFSNEKIVIIEAKADQKFNDQQLSDLKDDVDLYMKRVVDEFGYKLEIDAILLSSSCDEKEIPDFKNKRIYWNQLREFYKNKIYDRAESLGKKRIKIKL